MRQSVPLSTDMTRSKAGHRTLLFTAWAIVLLLTVPEIILRGFLQQPTGWLMPMRLVVLAALLGLSYIAPLLRPLRGLTLIFLVIYGVEGWFCLTLVPQSQLYMDIFGGDANLAFFGERLLRVVASLVMLLVLLGRGLKRQDMFLAIGNLQATAEPEKWGVPRRSETWPGFSARYTVIIVVVFLIFMVPALKPSLANLSVGLVVFAAMCALMNAFAEEFLYRSALLPQVLPLFGKRAALILVASWFGIGHYFGVPYGLTGIILTTIGGWIFAKSMVETRGMSWALFLHFVSDFTIYMIMMLAGAI